MTYLVLTEGLVLRKLAIDVNYYYFVLGFPGGSDGKEATYSAGDLGSIPGLGRPPRRREWLPTLLFLLIGIY